MPTADTTNPTADTAEPTVTMDSAQAEAAANSLMAELKAIPREKVQSPKLDAARASMNAYAAWQRATEKLFFALFLLLPKELFDKAVLEKLGSYAQASWHLALKAADARARAKKKSKLGSDLIETALELRGRMLKLLEYFFDEEPEIAPIIADIKRGSGHLDLANDLKRCAELYADHHDVISKDPKYYRADDAKNAKEVAETIRAQLGADPDPRDAEIIDLSNRAWTLMINAYDEVAGAGNWIKRREPKKPFPSIHVISRSKAKSAAKNVAKVEKGESKKDGAPEGGTP